MRWSVPQMTVLAATSLDSDPELIWTDTIQQELGPIFAGYTILSSKILRDSMGNSRGVGFARYVGDSHVLHFPSSTMRF